LYGIKEDEGRLAELFVEEEFDAVELAWNKGVCSSFADVSLAQQISLNASCITVLRSVTLVVTGHGRV
jgi:hypothetical protein